MKYVKMEQAICLHYLEVLSIQKHSREALVHFVSVAWLAVLSATCRSHNDLNTGDTSQRQAHGEMGDGTGSPFFFWQLGQPQY
jgi:hypothetical protein